MVLLYANTNASDWASTEGNANYAAWRWNYRTVLESIDGMPNKLYNIWAILGIYDDASRLDPH